MLWWTFLFRKSLSGFLVISLEEILRREITESQLCCAVPLSSLRDARVGEWLPSPPVSGLCCLGGLDWRLLMPACGNSDARLPRLFTWTHSMQSRTSPRRNHFIINLETKAYLINHGNPPSHLPLFLFWGRWQIFFPLVPCFCGWSSFPVSRFLHRAGSCSVGRDPKVAGPGVWFPVAGWVRGHAGPCLGARPRRQLPR